jgi:hypothetical protein
VLEPESLKWCNSFCENVRSGLARCCAGRLCSWVRWYCAKPKPQGPVNHNRGSRHVRRIAKPADAAATNGSGRFLPNHAPLDHQLQPHSTLCSWTRTVLLWTLQFLRSRDPKGTVVGRSAHGLRLQQDTVLGRRPLHGAASSTRSTPGWASAGRVRILATRFRNTS